MRVEIKSDGYELDDQIRNYVQKKLNKLSKRMSKHQKEAAHAIVVLKEQGTDPSQKYEAEILLRLPPKEEIIAREATINMYAAVDIVESKVVTQFAKYKDKHDTHRTDRKGSLRKLRRLADREFWGRQN